MTREEAIKGLKVLRKDFSGYKPNEEMFDMAIEALEQEPTAEYSSDVISRRAAINALAKEMPSLTTPDGCGEFDHEIQIAAEAFSDCMKIINDLPSAQPERPKGKWIATEYDTIKCGECGIVYSSALYPRKYCPNCGADMREANKK